MTFFFTPPPQGLPGGDTGGVKKTSPMKGKVFFTGDIHTYIQTYIHTNIATLWLNWPSGPIQWKQCAQQSSSYLVSIWPLPTVHCHCSKHHIEYMILTLIIPGWVVDVFQDEHSKYTRMNPQNIPGLHSTHSIIPGQALLYFTLLYFTLFPYIFSFF